MDKTTKARKMPPSQKIPTTNVCILEKGDLLALFWVFLFVCFLTKPLIPTKLQRII